MGKFVLLFNTVKFLKPVQVYYRLYYFGRRKLRNLLNTQYALTVNAQAAALTLQPSIASASLLHKQSFTFLNLSHTFENKVDWNYAQYGKLWTYNLTYFDYLQQEKLSKEEGLNLINDFIDQAQHHKDALEPFPISLRGINWVKFLTAHNVQDERINHSLYAQYMVLMDNLEYHLLGNHLLENGFSLLFGAYYFQDEKLFAQAKEILTVELTEQILEDGGHFELSPMYHQIMFFRVLDCLNLVQNNPWQEDGLHKLLKEKAIVMLQWLQTMTFKDGNIPLFNDSAKNIAPTTQQLNDYARALGITNVASMINPPLTDSGYRKVHKEAYECIVDIGSIGPDYIPGHAHADTLNFELYVKGLPFIVDTGLSTYETNARRTLERGTAAHNTVEVQGYDSSEVWGGFRVANRAYVTQLQESDEKIIATHNGYEKKLGLLHTRTWYFDDNKIVISDTLEKKSSAIARLHFHPDVSEDTIRKHITTNQQSFSIKNYKYAPEFNKLIDALVLEIPFKQNLSIEIIL